MSRVHDKFVIPTRCQVKQMKFGLYTMSTFEITGVQNKLVTSEYCCLKMN